MINYLRVRLFLGVKSRGEVLDFVIGLLLFFLVNSVGLKVALISKSYLSFLILSS